MAPHDDTMSDHQIAEIIESIRANDDAVARVSDLLRASMHDDIGANQLITTEPVPDAVSYRWYTGIAVRGPNHEFAKLALTQP